MVTLSEADWVIKTIAAGLLVVFSVVETAVGQQADQLSFADADGELDSDVTEIRLSDLAQPPPEIAALIRNGTVKLITGGGPMSDQDPLQRRGRLAGETRFTFRFRYSSHLKWQVESSRSLADGGRKMVRIQVRFRSVKLLPSHQIWLRRPPSSESFWDDPVVRHEFDHVRISSHPQVEKLFRDAVKKLQRIRVPVSEIVTSGQRVSDQAVTSLIESRMDAILKDTTEYVRIRYRELDRLTDHGLRPLPPEAGDLIETP